MTICDVGPRDGLQNQPVVLAPELRAELVNLLGGAGLRRIEVAGFVSPLRVPQMAGAEEVAAAIVPLAGVSYAGLVLNERGYDRLRESPTLDEVHYAFAASGEFNRRNAGASVSEGLARAVRILHRASADAIRCTITIATAFGCPFEGAVDPGRVHEFAAQIASAGADEIVVADTIGVAVPRQVRDLVSRVASLGVRVGVHLHNTRSTALANAVAALESGATVFDASVGGVGGCPFVPHATGNVATEDLVYLLHGEGIDTGIDLSALIDVAKWLETTVGHPLEGQVYKVGGFGR